MTDQSDQPTPSRPDGDTETIATPAAAPGPRRGWRERAQQLRRSRVAVAVAALVVAAALVLVGVAIGSGGITAGVTTSAAHLPPDVTTAGIIVEARASGAIAPVAASVATTAATASVAALVAAPAGPARATEAATAAVLPTRSGSSAP